MAKITVQGDLSPSTKSVLTITEKSRASSTTTFNINIKTNLLYSSSWVGTGIVLYGKVTISGSGITSQSKTITLKSSSSSWAGTALHTTTATFSPTINASLSNVNVKYEIWFSYSPTHISDSTSMSLTKMISVLNTESLDYPLTDVSDNPITKIFTITKYSNTYTQQLRVVDNQTNSLIALRENVGNEYAFVFTQEELNTIYASYTTQNNIKTKFFLDTYNEDNLIGSTYLSIQLFITNSGPVYNDFIYEDSNPITLALTGNNQKIINGYSTLKINTLTAQAQKSATLVSWIADKEYTYQDNKIIEIANYNFSTMKVSAVDSRTNSTSVIKNMTILNNYMDVIKGDQSINRIDDVTDQVNVSFDGSFWNNSFGAVNNSLNISYRYKAVDEPVWTTETSILPTLEISNNNFSYEGLLKGPNANNGFEIDKSYNIEITISDELSSVTYKYTLIAGEPAIIIKGNNVKKIRFFPIGSIVITSTNENPSSSYGGTWELFDKNFKEEDGNNVAIFTANTSYALTIAVYYILSGHSVWTRITFNSEASYGDTNIILGTLNYSLLGITRLAYSIISSTAYSDSGNGIAFLTLYNTTGEVEKTEVLTKTSGGTIPSGNTFNVIFNQEIPHQYMLDEFCDKFYWRRIS